MTSQSQWSAFSAWEELLVAGLVTTSRNPSANGQPMALLLLLLLAEMPDATRGTYQMQTSHHYVM